MTDKWIGVDLDGTLARHYWPDDGPYDHTRIGDPILPMLNRVRAWCEQGVEVRIFTARVGPQPDPARREESILAIDTWLLKHLGFVLPITATKDFRMAELWDDSAVRIHRNTGHRCCDGTIPAKDPAA